jgi:ELWxxDGT repeat protein
VTGRELWKTDGTAAGTVQVVDLRPGPDGSSPTYLTCCTVGGRDVLVFAADDGVNGVEPWMSDGTAAGTMRIADLVAGPGSSSPEWFCQVAGGVCFAAADPAHGRELWRSDLTPAGTALVRDVFPGPDGSALQWLVPDGAGGVLFLATDGVFGFEPWRSAGTAATTAMILDIWPGASSSVNWLFGEYVQHGGRTWFAADDGVHGEELWCTDGTASGTALVADVRPGSSGAAVDLFYAVSFGAELLFAANDGTHGPEPWATNGTPAGTRLLVDLAPGANGSFPSQMCVVQSRVFFSASVAAGYELYAFDGSSAALVADLRPGPDSSYPMRFQAFGGRLFFEASNGHHGGEPHCSDGTAAGTFQLGDLNFGSSSSDVRFWTDVGGKLIFRADDGGWPAPPAAGVEWWETDGTVANTRLFVDAEPAIQSGGSAVEGPVAAWGDTLVFAADDGALGSEPYAWSPATGLRLLGDLHPGIPPSSPSKFTPCGDRVFFRASGFRGDEPYGWDGSKVTEHDLRPGIAGSAPADLVACEGRLWFTADDGVHGRELWVSDPATGAVRMVVDLRPGALGSVPEGLTCCAGRVFFAADDGANGRELFVSDGTSAGTRLVAELVPGPSGSDPGELTCCPDPAGSDRLLFRATTPASGAELFRYDGSVVALVADLRPGSAGSAPAGLRWFGSRVVFVADDGVSGAEPWVTDGSAAGTFRLADVRAGSAGSAPSELTACGDRVVFAADDGVTGAEPWITDGTAAGTQRIADVRPGPTGSAPHAFACIGASVWFAADDGVVGFEPWRTDGTTGGTRRVCDSMMPGPASSNPRDPVVLGGDLWFVADGGKVGAGELWRWTCPGAAVESVGTGCGGHRLCTTAPVLGGVLEIGGSGGPARAGVLLAILSVAPRPWRHPLLHGDCFSHATLPALAAWPLAASSAWVRRLAVPSDPTLACRAIAFEAWFADAAGGLPLRVSNAVVDTLGR